MENNKYLCKIDSLEIPEFLKKKHRKTIKSLFIQCYLSDFWVKPFLLIKNKFKRRKVPIIKSNLIAEPIIANYSLIEMHTEKEALEEFIILRNRIMNYFSLHTQNLREFYFNYEQYNSLEYQNNMEHPIQSFIQIVPNSVRPYLSALKLEMESKGIQLTYCFPLKGEIGFITTKTKTRK